MRSLWPPLSCPFHGTDGPLGSCRRSLELYQTLRDISQTNIWRQKNQDKFVKITTGKLYNGMLDIPCGGCGTVNNDVYILLLNIMEKNLITSMETVVKKWPCSRPIPAVSLTVLFMCREEHGIAKLDTFISVDGIFLLLVLKLSLPICIAANCPKTLLTIQTSHIMHKWIHFPWRQNFLLRIYFAVKTIMDEVEKKAGKKGKLLRHWDSEKNRQQDFPRWNQSPYESLEKIGWGQYYG